MKLKKNQAWHFIRRDEHGIDRLRDGTEAPPDGVWLEFSGPLKMCESGLHFSRHPFDALAYAPGPVLCLVEVGGKVIDGNAEHKDKGICSRRKIIKRGDMTELLRYFSRQQALSVVHLWDAPDVVLDYLMTGDEGIRDAARDAAWAAARAAAWAVARAAAWDAARAAAWDAAWGAAWDAARAAARDAARAAAWVATREAAAWEAARSDFEALVMEAFS